MSDCTCPYRMSDRLAGLLALVRSGVHRKLDLCARSGLSMWQVKTLLESLAEHGYIVSVKTQSHDWSWVPIEQLDQVRADIAKRAVDTRREADRRHSAVRKTTRRQAAAARDGNYTAAVLALVREGVRRQSDLAQRTGHGAERLRRILHALAAQGLVATLRVDAHIWHWVPIEQLDQARADVAERKRATQRACWERFNVKRKAERRVPLPRGHGEVVRQAVVAASAARPIRKTAVSSVFELGGLSVPPANP